MNKRQSNFELLRIVSMAMIVLLHCNFYCNGAITAEDYMLQPVNSFLRVLAEQICIVAVNVFVLISGWFGIKASIKGLCSFFYLVFFWGGVSICFAVLFNIPISLKGALTYFYFGSALWFVPAYIILYCISPALNSFIQHGSRSLCLFTIVSFFIMEFIYGWFWNVGGFIQGYSTISFVGLYLIARYLGANWQSINVIRNHRSLSIAVFAISTLISVVLYLFAGNRQELLYYNSPFVILSSIALLMLFSTFKFNSKVVNWIACSTFPIYLFHLHPCIIPAFRVFVNNHFIVLSAYSYILFCIILTFSLFVFCVLIDKLRILSYKRLFNPLIDRTVGKYDIILKGA